MLESLSRLKGHIMTNRRSTETFVFYLHYRVTFLILMGLCVLITTKQFVEAKIQCLTNRANEISHSLLETYCWASSTYSVTSAYLKEVGIESPHPGIEASENESEYVYRNYYQYVHLVLFIQGLLFYLPHLIWKSIDRDHMDSFYNIINCKSEKEKPSKANSGHFNVAATYIKERWGTHTEYILQYLFCELLAAINIIIQFYLLDVFFHGEFLSLGNLISSHYNAERLKDPVRLFPLVTNCYFRRIGASGRIDTVDAYCVLPINALNVKIFLFLWIWFPFLLTLSFGNLFNLFFSFCIPKYRIVFLKLKSTLFGSHADRKPYMKLVTMGNFGDWFILSCIKSNMDELNFSRLMENLYAEILEREIEEKRKSFENPEEKKRERILERETEEP